MEYDLPVGMEFNSDDEMLNFSTVDVTNGRATMVKNGDTYTFYENVADHSVRYQAQDGAEIAVTDENIARIHRFGVKGSCMEIQIFKQENRESNGNAFNNLHKEVLVKDADTNTTVNATFHVNTTPDGTKTDQHSSYVKVVDGVAVDDRNSHTNYDEEGKMWENHIEIRTAGEKEAEPRRSGTTTV